MMRAGGFLLIAALALVASCRRGAEPSTTAQTEPTSAPTEPAPATAPDARPDLPGLSREPSFEERAVIAELMRDASRVRGLPFLRPVPTRIEDETRIRAFVAADAEAEELQKARDLYVTLGLLPPDVDLEALLADVLGEQILGYYDPEEGRLVVRDDVMRGLAVGRGDEARVVLVHELVHALQDQQLELGARHDEERDSDPENAYHALVEGDATLAMLAYALEAEGVPVGQLTGTPGMLEAIFEEGLASEGGGALDRAPAILRVTLTAPYFLGASFCAAAHRQGGWLAVDGVHRRIPTSTEQILHPEKYAAYERPVPVAIAPIAALEAAGYTRAFEDTLGELELSVYFAQGTGADQDDRAAAGWGGDRVALYTHPEHPPVVVLVTAWDDPGEAAEAHAAAAAIAARSAGVQVAREGIALVSVHGLPEPLRDRAAEIAAPLLREANRAAP